MRLLVDTIAYHVERELRYPFGFYGHSMGALISFELARELRRRHGIEPVQLFLSGRGAPHVRPAKPATFNLADDEFIVKLRELNGTPQELLEDAETMEVLLPILRADFEVVETYEYQPGACLSCPITVYGGIQDKEVPVGDLREWKEHSPAPFKVRLFPGDHFFIHASSVRFLEVLRLDISDSLRNLAGGLKSPPTCGT
jgi:medium-chain acyl-[acyl-carrier-protein] hydrolase